MRSLAVLLHSLACILALLAATPAAAAPETPTDNSQAGLSLEQVRDRIAAVESDKAIDDALRQQLLDLHQQTLRHLEQTAKHRQEIRDFSQTQQDTGDAGGSDIRVEPVPDFEPLTGETLDRMALPALEQALGDARGTLSGLQSRLDSLDDRLGSELNRPTQVQERLVAARQELEKLKQDESGPPGEVPNALREARDWLQRTRRQALDTEIRMLEQELLSRQPRLRVLQDERDRVAAGVDRLEQRVQRLEQELNRRRLAEADQVQQAAAETRRRTEGRDPLLQRLAGTNARLSDELRGMTAAADRINAREHLISEQAAQIETDLRRARQRLGIAGLTEALGQVLIRQRQRLREARQMLTVTTAVDRYLAEAGVQQIQHTEMRRDLRNLEEYLDGLLEDLPEGRREALRADARDLLEQRLELLDKVIAADRNHLVALSELEVAHQRLEGMIADYDAFLDRHLLWTRSAPAFDLQVLEAIPTELQLLTDPAGWSRAAAVLVREFRRTPAFVLVVITVVVLLAYRRRMRAALHSLAHQVGRLPRDHFVYTLQALLLMVLLALPWPLLLGAMGWQLQTGVDSDDFSKAVGFGLLSISVAFGFLLAFRLLSEPEGVGSAHFRWKAGNMRLLRHNLDRVMVLVLPLAFLTATASRLPVQPLFYGIGRLAYTAMMIAIAVFFWRTFHPERGVLAGHIARFPRGWLARLRNLWFPAAILIPAGLAGLALAGYMFTAGMMARTFINTLWLLLGIVILNGLVLRWLSLARGRLAYQRYLQRQEESEADGGTPAVEGEGLETHAPEPEAIMESLDVRTRKLLHTAITIGAVFALSLIWHEVIPAFGILGKISLWEYSTSEAGETRVAVVTLVDLAMAFILAAATLVVARHLPALLEITLLQRLTPEPGSRYAYSALLRYVIVGAGIIWVFNLLGGSWGQIQWLIAALGIGIGFGFQEIIANFVSGIIILFERPFRVGDVLTVGETSGTVTRIRIRATTITNWDKQELVVPNKDLITGRLLNWSLTDAVNRLNIHVGVAYGSDIPKALALLAEAARENEHVLDEPAPIITFDRFGDSALELLLRCYLGSIDHRLAAGSELHKAINDKFTAAGIVIAFPQRDIHIDSSAPLSVRLEGDAGGTSGER